MTTGVLLPDVERWLYSTLTGDGVIAGLVGTRVYQGVAPEGSGYPLIVFQPQSTPVRQAVGAIRVMDAPLYLVRAIDQVDSNQGSLQTLADRIADVLHGVAGVASGGVTILSSILDSEFALTEIVTGEGAKRYQHLGGFFRIRVQS